MAESQLVWKIYSLLNCKKLIFFCCLYSMELSLLAAHNNLRQLCISSKFTDLNDNFMDMVSIHGGLIHVALFVGSVTRNGITTLIRNSPNLLTFALREQKARKESYLKSLSGWLSKTFAGRKLFTSGVYSP